MIIRNIDIKDSAIVRAKAQTMAATMYPELIPDIDKMHWLVRDACLTETSYARVVGPIGEPGAVLIARTANNLWAMKKHASIMCWYSDIPGAGLALLRDFRRWVKETNGIVVAGFNDDCDLALEAKMVALRVGFVRRGGAYLYFPRGKLK